MTKGGVSVQLVWHISRWTLQFDEFVVDVVVVIDLHEGPEQDGEQNRLELCNLKQFSRRSSEKGLTG